MIGAGRPGLCSRTPRVTRWQTVRTHTDGLRPQGYHCRMTADAPAAAPSPAAPAIPPTTTDDLFRADAYLRDCPARVLRMEAATGTVVLDRTVFYPLGGGQAGDSGVLRLADGAELAIADTRKGKDAEGKPTAEIWHLAAPGQDALLARIAPGDTVTAAIDWERRHRMMRLHTASHLLCHLVAQPVNGCSITPEAVRVDFHMSEALDAAALAEGLAALVAQALPVTVGSVTDAELDANPGLVKSMSVQPPRGSGTVRTIRVGSAEAPIDLQPCGGTHVANIAEIGALRVAKVEKKGAQARRVVLAFGEAT